MQIFPITPSKKLTEMVGIFIFVLLLLFTASAWPQQPDSGSMRDMPGMNHSGMKMSPVVENAKSIAKRLADKRESEFNHRLAGLLVILAGIFAFWEPRLNPRSAFVRYGWGVCFLVAGLFLMVFSDTEIWPFGPQTPWYAVAHNPEDLQHKIFALILLGLGIAQIQTARGRLRQDLLAYLFPLMALVGSILLVFHTHSGDMLSANAMKTMEHVKAQHARFAATGVAIALTSVLAVKPQCYQQLCRKAWPLLLMLLGVLLMLYTE